MADIIHLEAQPIGDGTYRLALGRDELMELETGRSFNRLPRADGRTPKPIYEIFHSIMAGRIGTGAEAAGNPFAARASLADISAVVRLGLIGGGDVDEQEAAEIVLKYSPPHRPLGEMWSIAAALLYALLVDVEKEVTNA